MGRNTAIVVVNITAACLLLFCCCFFFFRNLELFKNDFTGYMIFSPLLFIAGIAFVCFYIIKLVANIESKTTRSADKYDLAYKIIFSCVLTLLLIRSFFGDFQGEGTMLNVPVSIIVIACLSGFITWLTPKIKDNDNREF